MGYSCCNVLREVIIYSAAKVVATIEFLEEEQEKFWKLHQQDEQALFDKIDMFTAQCMQLTLQNDFSKVTRCAAAQ